MQRQLTAIVSADVVGYSRLMARDETGTLDAISMLRKDIMDGALRHHSGRLIKSMGDGWLMAFDSVLDATQFSIAVQSALAQQDLLQLRIGVHIGDVVFGEDDFYGDGVNIAARIQSVAKPGVVWVSEDVSRQLKGKLDQPLSDLGTFELRNVDGRQRLFEIGDRPAPQNSKPAAQKPLLMIKPIRAVSSDTDHAFVADGLTEDLLISLSKFEDFDVAAETDGVGDDTGTYMFEGSLRGTDDRVRVTAKLVETASGKTLWAGRFDTTRTELLSMDETVSGKMASTLGECIYEETVRRKAVATSSLDDAYALTMRAWQHLRAFERHNMATAHDLAEQALALAPDDPGANRLMAWVLCNEAGQQWAPDTTATLQRAREHARRALSANNHASSSHVTLGFCDFNLGQHEAAISRIRHAIELNPVNSNAHALLGNVLALAGEPEQALETIQQAIDLNPRHPLTFPMYQARARYLLTEYDQACQLLAETLNDTPRYPSALSLLVACRVASGNNAEARHQADVLLRSSPDFRLSRVPLALPFKRAEDLDTYMARLRSAGVPE